MPRFVVLRHETPQDEHFDFMLEADGVLKTWALPTAPTAGAEIDCESLPDHRLAYLDYQGPISDGRGNVTQWDAGTYSIEEQDDDQWIVTLSGRRLAGRVALRRSADDPKRWRFSLGE